jgi:hypothetical protein
MKGYLERLTQTVANPAESVHPWAGSIFAGSYQGDIDAAKQATEVISPASAQSSQASATIQASLLGAERNSMISESRTTQMAPGSPLAEGSVYRGASARERIIPEPLITNTEGSAPESVETTELEITPAQELEPALPSRGRRSLAGMDAVIKPGNTRQAAVGPSHAAMDQKDVRTVRNSVAADRQSDEIQIHIGRIEVTAIHPPPPKRPKARDKEISLDAYLKRRDGRAG